MMEEPEIWDVGAEVWDNVGEGDCKCRQGMYEPGNGTSYTAIAVRLKGEVSLGILGMVEDGWLVVSGNTGKAYLFQAGRQPLMDIYIKQHLGGIDGDYPYMGDLIRKLIDRPGGDGIA